MYPVGVNSFQHVRFIHILKKAAELEQLRHARTKMAEVYPLTEGWIWVFPGVL